MDHWIHVQKYGQLNSPFGLSPNYMQQLRTVKYYTQDHNHPHLPGARAVVAVYLRTFELYIFIPGEQSHLLLPKKSQHEQQGKYYSCRSCAKARVGVSARSFPWDNVKANKETWFRIPGKPKENTSKRVPKSQNG